MKDQLIIRDATEQDVNALALLMNELGYPTTVAEMDNRLKKIIRHPDYHTIVVGTNGTIVAMAGLVISLSYEKNAKGARIMAFVTRQEYRNKGIGKALMEAVENRARQLGAEHIAVSSRNIEARQDAHAFYLKIGYQIKSSLFVKIL